MATLTFGKFKGRNIKNFGTREEMEYLFWLKNSRGYIYLPQEIKRALNQKIQSTYKH